MSERNGKYYTLAIWNPSSQIWTPEFGDPDYQCVKSEMQDYRDHGIKAKDMVIFHTPLDGGQEPIDEQIRKLNKRDGDK